MCVGLLAILQSNVARSTSDTQTQPSHSASYFSEHHDPQDQSASETSQHSRSSLIDSGCIKSPSSLNVVDEFDSLLRQLKSLEDIEFTATRSPCVQGQQTVPYFPPVTSALRRELGMYNCRQPACVEYGDDEALPSPQFIQMSSLHGGTSLLQEGSSLSHRGMSSLHGGTSVLHREMSLLQGRSSSLHGGTSLLQEGPSSSHRGMSSLRKGTSLLHKETSLLHGGSSSLHGGTSLLHKETSLLHEGSSSLHGGTSLLHKETSLLRGGSSSLQHAFSSPQFLPGSSLHGAEHGSSLADSNSVSVTDLLTFHTLNESVMNQFCSQSCPDVSGSASAAHLHVSSTDEPHLTSNDARFDGTTTCVLFKGVIIIIIIMQTFV